MQTISANNYSIYFDTTGYDVLVEMLSQSSYSKIFILVDENTAQFCLPHFLENLATTLEIEIIELEAGEIHKNIATCTEVWGALSDLGADRKSILLNLGGGVVSDLGGFVACTFQRGIDFVNIPTTLLAMVDASVGGKNGVDLGSLKNQIGSIREPKAVLIDPQFLTTLPAQEMRSGLAEMLKHGLIFDKMYWDRLKNLKDLTTADLHGLIHRSIQIKNTIVSEDFTEKGIRKALNFGHTLGHAIESYFLETKTKTTLLHGEAIAVGMVLESYISKEMGLLTAEEYYEIKYCITEFFAPIACAPNEIQKIIQLLVFDKKNEFGKVLFSLLDTIGKTKINQEVDNILIYRAFEDYIS